MRKLLLLLVLLFVTPAVAEEIPPSPIVQAQLLGHAPQVRANEPIWAGVLLTMPEHWHVYWKNPGDSGMAPVLTWTLPEGIRAGEIEWPAPERVELSGLVNFGYNDRVLLAVPLIPERNGISGEIKVRAEWLVCHDICIPESAELSLQLPHSNPQGAALIASTRDALPKDFAGDATFYIDGERVVLTLTSPDLNDAEGIYFFPLEDGIILNAAAQMVAYDGDRTVLTMQRGPADLVEPWHGVLRAGNDAWNIRATQQAAPPAAAATGLLTTLLLAFLGGLLLNIMPCVLPILALKALAIAKKSGAERKAVRVQGFAYTAGVIATFFGIASVMIALKSAGAAIGWGFQLQEPMVVLALFILMVLVAANLLGAFELPVVFGSRHAEGNAFFTGVLAVALATPCTAPFMAAALGATLLMPPTQSLLVFAFLGLGMASPFLLISLWPAARRLLPKPGAWMLTFKRLLAIPVIATAAWLLWVLVQLQHMPAADEAPPANAFSQERLAELRSQNKAVFVDVTAAWCITCKINERVALRDDAVEEYFREHGITLLVADWTMRDAAITEYLASFSRNGVPLYVYYPPEGEPVVLPQILTPSLLIETLQPQ